MKLSRHQLHEAAVERSGRPTAGLFNTLCCLLVEPQLKLLLQCTEMSLQHV